MEREPRSILMLGGSRQQVVAIEAARRLGYRTVLCDYLPDNPGQHHADVFYQESTTDRELMLLIAEREGVSGVLAYASDPAALTAAYVAEALGLPTNPLAAVETLSEKHLFRRHLLEHGFPCPRCSSVPADGSASDVIRAANGMRLPVVLKPTDSSGSKGVGVLDALEPEAVARALETARSFSRNGILELEEYISYGFPRVVGGDVFVVDGVVTFWGLMSCLRDERLGGLVPVGEIYPSGLLREQGAAVREQVQRLVSSLGIRFGEFNVEVIVGPGDVPYFLELGARAGGNMIPVQLSDISGVDLVEANVRCAMGETGVDVSFGGCERVAATYVLHARADGVYRGLRLDPLIERHVYRRVMYVEPGQGVERFDGANKALGILFLAFDSEHEMHELLGRAGDLIEPIVDPA